MRRAAFRCDDKDWVLDIGLPNWDVADESQRKNETVFFSYKLRDSDFFLKTYTKNILITYGNFFIWNQSHHSIE